MSARFQAFSYEDLLCLVQEYLRRLLHYFGQCFAQTSGITVLFKLSRKVRLILLIPKCVKRDPLLNYPFVTHLRVHVRGNRFLNLCA